MQNNSWKRDRDLLSEAYSSLYESVNLDEWMTQGSFETKKKAAEEKYEIAPKDMIIQTLEGDQTAKKGFYIMTGPKGEKYSMPPEKFNELKDDLGNGRARPKQIIKRAKVADHNGKVNTSWGEVLNYKEGEDVIIQHGPGDYGVVKKDIFAKTYSSLTIKPKETLAQEIERRREEGGWNEPYGGKRFPILRHKK